MDPQIEKRFERIESLLHATAVRGTEMEERFNRRMDRAEQRMDRAEQRMDRAEQRMEKFDRRLIAITKLIQHGMKLLSRNEEEIGKLSAEVRALTRFQRGSNGNGRRP